MAPLADSKVAGVEHVLIIDEVDGIGGNADRLGVGLRFWLLASSFASSNLASTSDVRADREDRSARHLLPQRAGPLLLRHHLPTAERGAYPDPPAENHRS